MFGPADMSSQRHLAGGEQDRQHRPDREAEQQPSQRQRPARDHFRNMVGNMDKVGADDNSSTISTSRSRTAPPYLIRAVLSGSDAVAIAGETANPVYSLMVKPRIQHFAELKGKTLGLSLPVDTISISMRKLLALHSRGSARPTIPSRNWWARRYVSIASSGESATRCRSVNPRISSLWGRATGDWVCRRRQWRHSNSRSLPRAGLGRRGRRDAVVRFVRALAAAFQFIRDRANREDVATAIVKLTGSPDQIARQTLALYFEPERGVLPKQVEIDLNGLTQVIAFMGEGGAIKPPLPQPERFVDLQYLRAAGVP